MGDSLRNLEAGTVSYAWRVLIGFWLFAYLVVAFSLSDARAEKTIYAPKSDYELNATAGLYLCVALLCVRAFSIVRL